MDGMTRVRSVAVSATVVVVTVVCTLVVTHAWSVGAAPGDSDSTFVPTAGCRLADTRSAPNTVGLRNTPLGAGGVFEVTVHGSNGECSGALAVPTDAVAVALNVTAVNASATSNVRLYPANLTSVPLLSNLNVTAGAPPIPNKVDVKLSPDGKIRVFNFAGSVDVVLDVVGYYTNSTLQELSQRVASLEAAQPAGVDPAVLARIDALETNTATNTSGIAALNAVQPFAVTGLNSNNETVTTDEVLVAVTVTAPVAGQVTVDSTATARESDAGDRVSCSITTGTTIDSNYLQEWRSSGSVGNVSQLAGTRTFDVKGPNPRLGTDGSATYRLVCRSVGESGSGVVSRAVLTAIFTPAR